MTFDTLRQHLDNDKQLYDLQPFILCPGDAMKLTSLLAVMIGASVITGAVQAQELTGTLKKIKDTGAITLGVRDSSIPFSYLDDKQSYQGYSIDLCMKIVTSVQKQLGLTSLNVKMNPVTSATRI